MMNFINLLHTYNVVLGDQNFLRPPEKFYKIISIYSNSGVSGLHGRRGLMAVNFMCQLDLAKGCPDSW